MLSSHTDSAELIPAREDSLVGIPSSLSVVRLPSYMWKWLEFGSPGWALLQDGLTGHTSWTRQGTAARSDQMLVLGGDVSLACVRRGVVRTLQVTALPSESLRTAGPGSEGAGL